ncbi:MAG: cysteine desulfurase family protein [Thermoanaerobaculia bacterium]
MDRIYFDNNASTILDPEVRVAMEQAACLFGNPSSIHEEGRRARRAVEEAREEVARLIEARPEEIFFTSGGTEANAMAIFGAADGGRIVTTGAEHPSVREPVAVLGRRGNPIEILPLEPDGRLDVEKSRAAISMGAGLISVMAANNEYGGLYPVAAIAEAAREAEALCHTDAVQAAGRVPLSVEALGVDLLSLSAHKLHGPKGAGALYVRRGTRLAPHTPGGGQEKKLRAGTENTPALVGFGVAARLARTRRESDFPRLEALRDRLEGAILSRTPEARIAGAGAPRLPNTSAVLFPGVSGEALAIRLDLEGVAVSVGSACSSGTVTASPALLALGLSRDEAKSVVRFSLSRHSTLEEVERVAHLVPRLVAEARAAGGRPLASAVSE